MKGAQREVRLKQLDRQLASIGDVAHLSAPSGGWIRSIREALGMTLEQFARRLGVASSSTAFQLERAEKDGSITVKRLRAAADSLGCDLVIALVPRDSLEKSVRHQARRKAEERLARLRHTMALESQGVASSEMQDLLERTTEELVTRGGPALWE